MSGQQAGTAIGFVAGFFLPGGPTVWAGIGGAIGGAVDPTKVQGPRLSDGMEVTAADGIPNTWGFGTFATGGNIINSFKLQEHSHTDDGKGSGMEQETFTYTRSYAIAICRAKRRTDGLYDPIAGVLRATHNGKVLYNTMPDASPEQLAQNSKFLETFKFYLGGEDQLPDPTLESYMGAGNVSAYRGEVIMVATDEDQTQSGGSIGTWEWVVAMEADATPVEFPLREGRLSDFANADFPLVDGPGDYDYAGYMGGNGFNADSIAEIQAHFATATGRNPTVYLGYSATTNIDNVPSIGLNIDDFGVSNAIEQPPVVDNKAVVLVYNDNAPDVVIPSILLNDSCPLISGEQWIQSGRGKVSRRFGGDPGSPYSLDDTCGDGDSVYGLYPLCIRVTRKRIAPRSGPPAGGVSIPDAPGFYLMPDGTIGYAGGFTPLSGTFKVLNGPSPTPTVDDLARYSYYENGPALVSGDPNYSSQAYWEARYAEALSLGNVPSGWDYPTDYPLVVSTVWEPDSPALETLDIDGVLLSTIVAEICRRSGLDDDDFDVSQLTDVLEGFKVAVETTGEALVQTLQKGFRFDCVEQNDKLCFVKRGGDVQGEIAFEDLCERDGPAIQETEVQEVELLWKVHVKAMDPAAGYVETTQTAERRSSTVAAKGEQTIPLPIVASKDTQAQIADMAQKIGWSELLRFDFDLPFTMPQWMPTDRIGLTDRSGRRRRVRLMDLTEDTGRRQFKDASLDRQSSYTSNVEGVFHAPPTDTSPGLIGPTFLWVGNLPSLRTQDNVPGMYFAGCGFMRAWGGYVLLMSVDNGESFQQVAITRQASTMGTLTADVSASGEPISVFMNFGTLSSISEAQLSNRMNAFAITSDTLNGPSELGQFKTATLDSGQTYDLTDLVRGGLGTTPAAHFTGDPFVMVATATFLPIDISHSGKTLIFKAVSIGTSADETPEYPVKFNPLFTTVIIEPYTDDAGNVYTDDADNIYYYEASA